jgi:hypothetical protein
MKPNTLKLTWTIALFVLAVLPAHAFYNPTTGRWLSRDPMEESAGPNLFGFVENRTPDYLDVLGACTACPTLAVAITKVEPEVHTREACNNKGELEFKTSDPVAITTKEDMKLKCPRGQAACSKPDYSYDSTCVECKCGWKLVIKKASEKS